MEPPRGEDTPEDQAVKKRLEAVAKAFELLERNPDFPSVQVRIHDREQEIEKSTPEGAGERLSDPRFEYCISLLDLGGEEYLPLVVDLESHKAIQR